jgi:hypothetical protein
VAGENPDGGAVIWFHLGPDFKSEAKIEILDSGGKVIATATGKANPDRKVGGDSDEKDKEKDEGKDEHKRKLEPKPGLNRFVWDLTHDGATTIPDAAVDSGTAGARVPVAPGTYTVRLTVGNQKLTQKGAVVADPRFDSLVLGAALKRAEREIPVPEGADVPVPLDINPFERTPRARVERQRSELALKYATEAAGYAEQEALALRVRDDITKLSDTVHRIRAVKKQIDLRKELLKDRDDAKALLKQSEALAKKLDDLEGKLHNPKAKISYDIFAARGGAMLYSQLVWLLGNLTDGDGAPTKAQKELTDELGKELAGLLGQFDTIAKTDLAKLNADAKKLGVPELYLPPAKKTDADPPVKK